MSAIDFGPADRVPQAVQAEHARYARHIAGVQFARVPHGVFARDSRTITGLPAAERRAVWRQIQADQPALAALLQSEALQSVMHAFDAQLLVPR